MYRRQGVVKVKRTRSCEGIEDKELYCKGKEDKEM